MHHIYHNLTIKASPEKVFECFTNPIHLNNWWTLQSSGKPEIDEVYNLNFTAAYNWFAKVTKVEQDKFFFLTMTSSDKDWDATTFGIDLEENENGTLLRFSHQNWEEANNHFKHSSFCWAILLNGFKNYVEKGIIIPFEQRN